MSTSTVVILLVLAVIIVFAIQSSVKHLRGQGGCCGGDSSPKAKRKKLDNPIAKKLVTIEGMHCDNCKNRIEKTFNEMDGVACVVNLHKKTATITMSKLLDDSIIKDTIEKLDFKVLKIVNNE